MRNFDALAGFRSGLLLAVAWHAHGVLSDVPGKIRIMRCLRSEAERDADRQAESYVLYMCWLYGYCLYTDYDIDYDIECQLTATSSD